MFVSVSCCIDLKTLNPTTGKLVPNEAGTKAGAGVYGSTMQGRGSSGEKTTVTGFNPHELENTPVSPFEHSPLSGAAFGSSRSNANSSPASQKTTFEIVRLSRFNLITEDYHKMTRSGDLMPDPASVWWPNFQHDFKFSQNIANRTYWAFEGSDAILEFDIDKIQNPEYVKKTLKNLSSFQPNPKDPTTQPT